jgi:hypothetical protein
MASTKSLLFVNKKKQKTLDVALALGGRDGLLASPPHEPSIQPRGAARRKSFLLLFFKKEDSSFLPLAFPRSS